MHLAARRVALVTGVTGQTGSYLVDLLLAKGIHCLFSESFLSYLHMYPGYEVHGVSRGTASDVPARLAHVLNENVAQKLPFTLHHCDIMDVQAFTEILRATNPDELYNLAAQSSVGVSFKQPLETIRVDGLGVLSILETVRNLNPAIRIFLASSSEIFGQTQQSPQTEDTKPRPCSPYAIAKLMAHCLARLYREAYGMFVCSGILYNHESSRRGSTFVTQKIVRAAVRISLGLQQTLRLGNLASGRDWGHAEDFAECAWRMLQTEVPEDFVVATGTSYTVREFAQFAFKAVGLDLQFIGEGVEEVGVDTATGVVLVEVDADLFRPAEPNKIIGDFRQAREKLSWKPTRSLGSMIEEMVAACRLELSKFSN